MKKPIHFLSGLATLAFALTAGAQDLIVTPATLSGWQVSGVALTTLQAQSVLSLPSGSQLTRAFNSGSVVVDTLSSPNFGLSSTDWPILQVGPAALVMVRQGNEGQLVLVVDQTVNPLPLTISLDANGQTLKPLELALGYDPVAKAGVVAFADQVQSFKSTTDDGSIEVAVSAGATGPWTQNSLEVLVLGPDDQMPDSSQAGNTGTDATKRAALLQTAAEKLRQAAAEVNGLAGTSSAGAKPKAGNAGAKLEIYTPAAVRKSNVAGVRAAVAQSQRK